MDASHEDGLLVEIVEETPKPGVIDDCEESPKVQIVLDMEIDISGLIKRVIRSVVEDKIRMDKIR